MSPQRTPRSGLIPPNFTIAYAIVVIIVALMLFYLVGVLGCLVLLLLVAVI